MNAVFADTFYYLALVSEDDRAHPRAVAMSRTLQCRVVTTAWVLTEVGDALASPAQRRLFPLLLQNLRGDSDVTIVLPTEELFDLGIDLYARRPDKAWSLTDCISFVVMQQLEIQAALTGDRHFEQAGFRVLLS